MSFVMPSEMKMEDLPIPNDSSIRFVISTIDTVATLRFSGFASDRDIYDKTEVLKKWLETKKIIACSDFRYLGYNPPYQFINRRNEIMVSIKYK